MLSCGTGHDGPTTSPTKRAVLTGVCSYRPARHPHPHPRRNFLRCPGTVSYRAQTICGTDLWHDATPGTELAYRAAVLSESVATPLRGVCGTEEEYVCTRPCADSSRALSPPPSRY
eukprot:2274099-Rhodomonas_salina.3